VLRDGIGGANRIITHHGRPQGSVCPFCAGAYKEFVCFIATAVYGDHYASEVIALRRFRDETLEQNAFGLCFITIYYKYSPPGAAFLSRRPVLSEWVRHPLDVLARRNGYVLLD